MNFPHLPLLLLFIVCSCSAPPDPRIAEIDELFTGLHLDNSFSGNVLIAEKGEVIYEKSLGRSSLDPAVDLRPESIFNVASVSKTFTALSILQLTEQGRLNLDDGIKTYFPDFPYAGITISHLLSHTSGLYRIQSEPLRGRINKKGLNNAELLEVYQAVQPDPYFPPGTDYGYANTNYILLALIVEYVSELAFHDYLQTHIFDKADMETTFLMQKRVPANLQDRIVRYYRKPNWLSYEMEDIGTLEDDRAEQLTFENNYGASSIYTTARDLLKYHTALLDGTLLDTANLRKMYTPFTLVNGADYVVSGNSNYPALSGRAWRIAKDQEDGQIVFHSGGFRGGRSFFIRNLTKDQCVIILTNNSLTDRHTFTTPMCILNGKAYLTDKSSAPKLFAKAYLDNGIDSALAKYQTMIGNENFVQFIDWDYEEIGEELMAKKDFAAAVALFQRYAEAFPEDEYSWSLLGDAYYGQADFDKATTAYQKALEVNPDQEHATEMLQKLKMQNGDQNGGNTSHRH